MDITTVSSKFQVVIPRNVRERQGIQAGQKLQVLLLPGRIELVLLVEPASLRGLVSGPNDFQRDPERPLADG